MNMQSLGAGGLRSVRDWDEGQRRCSSDCRYRPNKFLCRVSWRSREHHPSTSMLNIDTMRYRFVNSKLPRAATHTWLE